MHPTHIQRTSAFSVAALSQCHHLPSNDCLHCHTRLKGFAAVFVLALAVLITLLVFHFLALCPSLCLPLSVPCYASNAIFHFSGKTGIIEGSAPVCLIKE